MPSPEAAVAPLLTSDDALRDRRTLCIATLGFVLLAIIGAVGYRGFIEGDATNHYLIARFAVDRPSNFVNVWGRPLTTLLYALPAQIGRHTDDIRAGVLATRGLSILLALFIAFVTYRLARGQGLRSPALAVVFVFAQPIFYVHAFSEMTEIPFAAILAGAFWAYQSGRWFWVALLVGLLPLGRPEGFGFILLAAGALVWYRRWMWLPILVIPFLAWNYAGWAITKSPGEAGAPWYLWVKANWPYSASSAYGSGAIWDLPMRVPLVVGAVVFPLTCIGTYLALKGIKSKNVAIGDDVRIGDSVFMGNDNARATQASVALRATAKRGKDASNTRSPSPHLPTPPSLLFWTAALPLLVLIGHTILWWRGWMGSNGGARYLVICTPLWALLTARGWEWARDRYQPRYWRTFAVFASLAPLLITFTGISYPNIPLIGSDKADRVAGKIAEWWRQDAQLRQKYPRILSSLPTMSYYLDLDLGRPEHSAEPGKSGIRKRTAGTMLIWDPNLGATNSDRNLGLTPEEIRDAGWVHVRRFDNVDLGGQDWADVYLSPTDIDGKVTIRGMEK